MLFNYRQAIKPGDITFGIIPLCSNGIEPINIVSVPVIERINSLKKNSFKSRKKSHTLKKFYINTLREDRECFYLILAGSSARRRNYWRKFLPDLLACGLCPPYWVARAPGCDRAPRAPDSFIKVGVGESGRMWRHAHKDGWRPQGCDVKKPRQERGNSVPHVWIQFL